MAKTKSKNKAADSKNTNEQKVTKKEEKTTKKDSGSKQKRTPKPINIWIVVLVIFLVALAGLAGYLYQNKFVVARVNGEPITRFELWETLEKQGGEQTLDNLVTQKLIEQKAAEQGVVISPEDIQAEIQEIEQNLQVQGMTLDDALSAQGMTTQDLIEQLRLQRMLEELALNNIEVTDQEIDRIIGSMSEPGDEVTPELREQAAQQVRASKESSSVQEFLQMIRDEANIDLMLN